MLRSVTIGDLHTAIKECCLRSKMDPNTCNGVKTSQPDTLLLKRPIVDTTQALALAQLFFGFYGTDIKEFESYDDRNFYMKGSFERREQTGEENTSITDEVHINTEEEFVLKVLNYVDSADCNLVDAQNEFCLGLSKNGFQCPVPVQSLNGDYKVMWKNSKSHESSEGVTEAVRLLRFVPGQLLKDIQCSPDLLYDLGKYMARFNQVAQEFSHPAIEHRVYHWDLQHINQIEQYILSTTSRNKEGHAELLKHVYERFCEEVLPRLTALNKQTIHNDFNEANILTLPVKSGKGYRISGILDCGDVCYSYRVFEVAICMAYMIVIMHEAGDSHSDAIHAVGHVLRGYQEIFPLSPDELDLIYWSVAARICQSLAISDHQMSLEPDNTYLDYNKIFFWEVLEHYVNIPKDELMDIWCSQK